jgi:hypothetical protein
MTTARTLIDRPATRFARHYAEMLVAMLVGMMALGMPADMALSGLGVELADEAPAALLLGMGITMTVPMVAWMRYRGHGWPASNEMAASMMIPTVGVIALLAAELVEDTGTLLVIEHLVMLPAMLAVMLLRWDEYTHAH